MKLTAMAYAYPFIMKGIIKKQLKKYYDKAKLKNIITKTTREYKKIVKNSPNIGGNKNIFLNSYLMGAYLVSLYKNTKDIISLNEFDEILANGLNNFEFMKKQMSKVDLLSIQYKEKIEKAGRWCETNKDKYPTNWLVSVEDKENVNLTHIVFTRCGLCALCKRENVPELTPSLCATDYITMSFANCRLERPITLGNGDKCCNFYITKKNHAV